ncbi:MAG: BrnT family toxin [Trueperaceae bacterium]|nr:MAG: BrnT family toxin [Trueperaceae bacterium]
MTSQRPTHFIWDEINLRKVERHRLTPEEIEEVFTDPTGDVRRTRKSVGGQVRYQIIGRTESGRLLKVPFEISKRGIRPITAFDAGKRDYHLYWRKR